MYKNSKNTCILAIISYLIMITFILIIIPLHLFPCFFSGFLTYEIITSLTSHFKRIIGINQARWLSIILIISIISISIALGIINFSNFLIKDISNNFDIITEINRIFSNITKKLPTELFPFLPNTTEEFKKQIFSWIESNLIFIRNMGHTFLHGTITLFIGLVVGILISFDVIKKKSNNSNTYFISQLLERSYNLSQAFHNIVFAQIKISLINTLLTSIMIFLIFPIFDYFLPLRKTLIISTFVLGLLPIIGNLISNVAITISALSISLGVGIIMFIYLILIHKLEYFLNAEIIGNKIQAKPWELILSMLLLEATFGLEGLIAAPIYYAYFKIELRAKHII